MTRLTEVIEQQKKKLPDPHTFTAGVCKQVVHRPYPVTLNVEVDLPKDEPYINIYWSKQYGDGGSAEWKLEEKSEELLKQFLLT